ncbi:MAG: DUF2007 domain-containing protein [Acidobacteriia bacterium]|nr:DUF2007 domain-containing protein [Terriglobia bacterium]
MPWCPKCGEEYREGFTRCSECGVALVAVPPAKSEALAEPGPAWVEVASYTTAEEARLAQGLLEEQGIAAEVVDKHVVLNPFPQVDEAEVLLLVAPEDAERADAVLAQAEAGDDTLSEDVDADADTPGETTR